MDTTPPSTPKRHAEVFSLDENVGMNSSGSPPKRLCERVTRGSLSSVRKNADGTVTKKVCCGTYQRKKVKEITGLPMVSPQAYDALKGTLELMPNFQSFTEETFSFGGRPNAYRILTIVFKTTLEYQNEFGDTQTLKVVDMDEYLSMHPEDGDEYARLCLQALELLNRELQKRGFHIHLDPKPENTMTLVSAETGKLVDVMVIDITTVSKDLDIVDWYDNEMSCQYAFPETSPTCYARSVLLCRDLLKEVSIVVRKVREGDINIRETEIYERIYALPDDSPELAPLVALYPIQ